MDIAKQNGKYRSLYANIDSLSPIQGGVVEEETPELEKETGSYLILFKNKWLRKRFILFTIVIIYVYFANNGVAFVLGDLSGDIYANALFMATGDLLASIASGKES